MRAFNERGALECLKQLYHVTNLKLEFGLAGTVAADVDRDFLMQRSTKMMVRVYVLLVIASVPQIKLPFRARLWDSYNTRRVSMHQKPRF